MVVDDPAQDCEHPASAPRALERKPWQTPRFEQHDVQRSTLQGKSPVFPSETTGAAGPAS